MTPEPRYKGTQITQRPDIGALDGPVAAWRIGMPPPEQRLNPDERGTVTAWIVRADGAHAFWNFWIASVVHLRDIPGGSRPAVKKFAAATHEILVFALDPGKELPQVNQLAGSWGMLHPVDIVEQFEAADDAAAAAVLDAMIQKIADGQISPDQDHRKRWQRDVPAEAARIKRDGVRKQ